MRINPFVVMTAVLRRRRSGPGRHDFSPLSAEEREWILSQLGADEQAKRINASRLRGPTLPQLTSHPTDPTDLT